MIEFDVDMGYLLEDGELDAVVLNDENGEHEPMRFIPDGETKEIDDARGEEDSMTVASYSYGENPRYDKMNYAEVRNELDKRDKLIKDMWPFILRSSISHYELDELEDRLFEQGVEV